MHKTFGPRQHGNGRRPAPPPSFFPSLESLELRLAPAAVTFIVNTLLDTHLANPASTNGIDTNGKVSLRSALEAAENFTTPTTVAIQLAKQPGVINLSLGELTFGSANDDNITITGATSGGAPATTIKQTDGKNRIFDIDPGAAGSVTATINNVTLQGGFASNSTAPFASLGGGAILGGSTGDVLNLTNDVLTGNASDSGDNGGAIAWALGGNLNVSSSTFTNNTSNVGGAGAIFFNDNGNAGNLSITNSSFTGNTATAGTTTAGNAAGKGGALAIFVAAGSTATIGGTTFDSNVAVSFSSSPSDPQGQGGAVYFLGDPATASPAGTATITDSTFTNNKVQQAGGGGPGQGGAVFVEGGNLSLSFSRLAGNVGATGRAVDNSGDHPAVVSAANDWWATNAGPGAFTAGTVSSATWLVLTDAASPTTIGVGQNSTLTADFTHDNTGTNVAASDPAAGHSFPAFIGVPVTYGAVVDGNLSNQQVTMQSGGTATATYTATTAGAGSSTVAVDGATVTAPITVQPSTDLQVGKSDSTGTGSAVPGTAITYTVTVHNAGPSAVSGATIADTFPAALSGVGYTASATGGASGFTATGSGNISDTLSLPVGSTVTYTATATISPSATGTLSNTATAATPAGISDTDANGSTATDTVTLKPQADLQVSASDNTVSGSAVPGTAITYTITVHNAGPSAVSGATIADTFPTALSGATFTASAVGGASGFTANGSGNISDSLTLPVGSTVTYTATATISPAATGTLSDTAKATAPGGVTDTDASGSTATDAVTLTPQADLQVSASDNTVSGSAVPGTAITYTITAHNAGPSVVTGATIADTFPATLSGVTFTAVPSGGATGSASGGGNISQTLNLPAGSTVTYTATATISPAATGTLSDTAKATAPGGVTDTDASGSTATDAVTLTPQADLQVSASDNTVSGSAVPGTAITYTITAHNAGPSVVTGATIADTFPATLSGVTFTAVQAGGATGASGGGGNISQTLTLPVGSTVTYTATATISAAATGTLSNTATAATPAGVTDTDANGSTATDSVTLTPRADLQVSEINNTGTGVAVPGTGIAYQITVHNAGPSAVSGATIADTFPAALSGVTFTASATGGASGFTANGSGNIADTLTLPANSTVTYTATATISPAATGTLSDTAKAAAPAGVTDTDANGSTATSTVILSPGLTSKVSASDNTGTGSAVPGTAITYTVTVHNAGPSAVSGATIADTFPAALSGVGYTASATGGASGFTANGSGNISDTLSLPVGSTVTYTATATISAAATGTLSDTATATAPAGLTDTDTKGSTATDTITLTPQADLQVSASDNLGTGFAVPGTAITYTITVHNAGPNAVSGANVTDLFPATLNGVTFTAGATGGASGFTANGSGNINDSVTLPVGGTITYTATATISPSATGTLSNTAKATAPAGVTDTDANHSTATDAVTLTPQADLQVSASDNTVSGSAVPGTAITYTITVHNAGPSAVSGATIADTFPATLSGVTFTAVPSGGATGAASGGGNISQTLNLPAGSTVTYTATATISAAATGTLSNTGTATAPAGVTDTDANGSTATDTVTLTPRADLQVSASDNTITGSAVPSTAITYTITVHNAGPSAITGATIADTFPAALSGVVFTAVPAGGATGAANGGGNIRQTLTLPAGGSVTYTATATISPSATGTLSNTATAAAPAGVTDTDANGSTATDSVTLAPKVDLQVSVTDNSGAAGAVPATAITYTITVHNAGPSAVTGATIADLFPAALSGVGYSAGATGGASGFTANGSGNISDTLSLPTNSTVTYTATATISATASGTLSNTATATTPAGVTNTDANNSTATDTVVLKPQADLQVSTSDSAGNAGAVPGRGITYTITVHNAGPSAVSGATIADLFPVALSGVGYSAGATGGASGFTANGSGNISDTLSLPVGSTVTYTASATISPSAVGTLSNTATAATPAGVTDTDANRSSATDNVILTPQADLQVTQSAPASVPAAADLTYTITVINVGPSTARNVSLIDLLPPGETFVSQAQTSGSAAFTLGNNGNQVTDVITSLESGASAIFTVTAHVQPAALNTTLINTVTGTASDLALNDNTTVFTVTTTVHGPVIVVSPATLTTARVGVAYSQAFSASGATSPYTFHVTAGSLPAGLSLNATTGVLAGTPQQAATFTFTVTATDANGSTGSASLALSVQQGALARLVFLAQPTAAAANSFLAPFQVKALDRFGNPLSGVIVNLALSTIYSAGPTGFLAGSVLHATTVNGVATFSSVAITTTRGLFQLRAYAPLVAGIQAYSNSFEVGILGRHAPGPHN